MGETPPWKNIRKIAINKSITYGKIGLLINTTESMLIVNIVIVVPQIAVITIFRLSILPIKWILEMVARVDMTPLLIFAIKAAEWLNPALLKTVVP